MWIKRSGIVFITLIFVLTSVLLRVCYVSQSDLAAKTRSVAGRRTAKIELYRSKGVIYDRELCPLAGGQPVYYLAVDPRRFDRSRTAELCELTDSDPDEIADKLGREAVFVLKSSCKPDETDGVYVFEGTYRYPAAAVSKHLLGYLDSACETGVAGIEKAFDKELSVYSNTVYLKYSKNAVNGVMKDPEMEVLNGGGDTANGLILTIDGKLSAAAETALREHVEKGAVVVMDCSNGEVLAMSSLPDFDVGSISKYMGSDGGELVNNATARQTVGSVFKIVVAISAIQNGLENFKYDCTGGINVAGRTFVCQNNRTHGTLDLSEAFSLSCNAYFIALGQLLGYDKIIETAQLFGVDSSIELAKNTLTASGVLPEENGILSVANLSLGQGELMASPLEIARITAAVCNGGFLVNPTVYCGTYIDGIIGNRSRYTYRSGVIAPDTAEKLRQMCIRCVESGTGTNARPERGGAGGKTASAQTGIYKRDGSEQLNTYFTGFYPADDPKYVITVFALDGKSGSSTCAPVFRKICDFIEQNY